MYKVRFCAYENIRTGIPVRIIFLIAAGLLLATVRLSWAQISFLDAAGRRVDLPAPPDRIVVAGFAPFIPLHMLYMFEEARETLVGYEQRFKGENRFLGLIDQNFHEKTALNSNPAVESIIALKPDLVIAKAGNQKRFSKLLSPVGIPVMYVGGESPELFLSDIQNLGQVLDNPERARAIVAYYREKLALIRQKTEKIPQKNRPGVLVLEYSNRGKAIALNVPARSWIQTRQAEMAGGHPVWTDAPAAQEGWQITGFEQIAQWNPDKIFMVVWYRLQGPKVLEDLYTDDKWQQLKAVQANQLWLFPQDLYGWDSMSPRWILGALWMNRMICPEKYRADEFSLETMVSQFFKRLYFMDDAAVRTHILPEIAPYAVE